MSSLNIPKDGICWTSLYNLFQKCFTSLTEGLFPRNIQSKFVLLLLPIAVIHFYMHTSLLWEEFFFLFSITSHQVQKTANRNMSDSQLQAKESCLGFYVCLCKSYLRVYMSCTLVSYLSWWHSAGVSPVSHSQGNRTGHCTTPSSASWILGRRELPFLFVPPTAFLPTNPISGLWYCLKGVCLFHWPGCRQSLPTNYYCIDS